jgi:hypothetical protein
MLAGLAGEPMSKDEPDDATLDRIRKWETDWPSLLLFMRDAWSDYGVVKVLIVPDDDRDSDKELKQWEFVTGGWSGNEEIMQAFYSNPIATAMLWKSTHRGGLHVLREP